MRILTLCVFLSAQGLQAQSPPEEQTAEVTTAQDKTTESEADTDWGKLLFGGREGIRELREIYRPADEAIARFKLYNDCRTMRLLIENLGKYAEEIDLTKDRLQSLVESRLRSARLYTEDSSKANGALLYVNIQVIGPAFWVWLNYKKRLKDPVTTSTLGATTWQRGTLGTHASDGGYILQSLSEYLDRFLVEYLRVNNEEACAEK